jgi:hypothetical protein
MTALHRIIAKHTDNPAQLATLADRWRRRAHRERPDDAWVAGWAWAHAYDAASLMASREISLQRFAALREKA